MNKGTEVWTLEELLKHVPDTRNSKLPTARQLKMSGTKVLTEVETVTGQLAVYDNGYFVYRSGRRVTVQSLHKCQEAIRYTYENGETSIVGMEVFAGLPYTIRLTLEGESRLEENQIRRESAHLSYCDDILNYAPADFTDALTDNLTIERACQQLTLQQRQILTMYFEQCMSQQEIANLLCISRRSVRSRLKGAMKRVAELFRENC